MQDQDTWPNGDEFIPDESEVDEPHEVKIWEDEESEGIVSENEADQALMDLMDRTAQAEYFRDMPGDIIEICTVMFNRP